MVNGTPGAGSGSYCAAMTETSGGPPDPGPAAFGAAVDPGPWIPPDPSPPDPFPPAQPWSPAPEAVVPGWAAPIWTRPMPAAPIPSPRRSGLPPIAWVAVAFGLVIILVAGAGLATVVGGAVLAGVRRSAQAAASDGPSGAAAIASGPDARVAGIRKALSAMTEGVRGRNQATFLSAVDVRRSGVLARARARFVALSAVPLQDPEFSWSGEFAEAEPYDPTEPVTIVAEFSYRLRGWDTRTAHDPMPFRFGPFGDGWVVIDDTASAGGELPIGPYAEPWSVGTVVTAQKPHVLVIGDARHRSEIRRLAVSLERVVGDVRRVWPEPSWNGKVIAYAATDRRFVNEWFGDQAADGRRDQPDGRPSFEARVVSLPGEARDGQWERGPTRLVVTPYLLRQADDYSVSVLRHEVTHVATDHIGRYPPAWLLEGAAEYTGFRRGGARVNAPRTFAEHGVPPATAQAMRRGRWRPVLVTGAGAFYRGTSRAVEDAYTDGWIASLYVADRYGDATLRRLYHVACAQPESAGEAEVDKVALRAVLDTDHEAFTAAVQAYGIKLRKRFP
jgi:hypothetical protein